MSDSSCGLPVFEALERCVSGADMLLLLSDAAILMGLVYLRGTTKGGNYSSDQFLLGSSAHANHTHCCVNNGGFTWRPHCARLSMCHVDRLLNFVTLFVEQRL